MAKKPHTQKGKDPGLTRREFTQVAGAAIAGVTVAALAAGPARIAKAATANTSSLPVIDIPAPLTTGVSDTLVRMQQELLVALKKSQAERHWRMVIDLRKCVGCSACTIACVSENKLPPGVVYRPVFDEELGKYPRVTRRFTPRPCMQCEKPSCVKVCPASATWKQADGVVVIDYEKCIGCRYCITACPYSARTFDFGETYNHGTASAKGLIVGEDTADDYERVNNFEYGKKWDRPEKKDHSPIGNARKCHFCLHRVENGVLPACVTTCIGRATYFGDSNNPDSLVSQVASTPSAVRLKEEFGTEPNVYYLI